MSPAKIVAISMIWSGVFVLGALAMVPLGVDVLSVAVGGVLASMNLLAFTYMVKRMLERRRSLFYGGLVAAKFLVLIALFYLAVRLGLHVISLGIGFSVVLPISLHMGMGRTPEREEA